MCITKERVHFFTSRIPTRRPTLTTTVKSTKMQLDGTVVGKFGKAGKLPKDSEQQPQSTAAMPYALCGRGRNLRVQSDAALTALHQR